MSGLQIPPRLGAFIAVVLWGISFVATKAALREAGPVTVIFLRFAIGALLLACTVRTIPPRDAWPSLALMGFIGIFFHQMLQSFGLTMTTAVHTGWLIGLTPIWSALLSAARLRERFGAIKIAGLIGGFAGALLVITHGRIASGTLAMPSTRGDLLILVSTVNWAVYSVVGHSTIRRLGPRVATSGAMAFGVIMLAPFFAITRGWRDIPRLTATGWSAILFLAVGCSALGYLFWYGALERVEVSRVASLLYLEPLVTFTAGVAMLHETVSATAIAGGLLVLGSVLLTQYAPARTGVAELE